MFLLIKKGEENFLKFVRVMLLRYVKKGWSPGFLFSKLKRGGGGNQDFSKLFGNLADLLSAPWNN